MTILSLTFPNIDPTIVQFGPFAIRWYAVAYIVGLFGGIWYARILVKRTPALMTPQQIDDFLVWALAGILIGGRLGYVLFYNPSYYFNNPSLVLMTWRGGMSFHGGLIGVIISIIIFSRIKKINRWYLADNVGCAVPIGLFLGRIANFINGELYGRVATNVEWAIIFPKGGLLPRHPSQLYEALLEGLLLFIVMHLLWRRKSIRSQPGLLTGYFCIGYSLARITSEFFREPDSQIGFFYYNATMGQILSALLLIFGFWVLFNAQKRK